MIKYLNVGALEQSEQANEGEGKAVKIEMKNYDFYRTQVSLVRSMDLVVSHSLTHLCANLIDVTLADKDTKLCKLCKLCK